MDLQALKALWGKPPAEPEELTTDPDGVGDEMGKSKTSLYDLPNEVCFAPLFVQFVPWYTIVVPFHFRIHPN
jgi:hypothetical protein